MDLGESPCGPVPQGVALGLSGWTALRAEACRMRHTPCKRTAPKNNFAFWNSPEGAIAPKAQGNALGKPGPIRM